MDLSNNNVLSVRLNVNFIYTFIFSRNILKCWFAVSTKADVRFHVQTAEWIPEEVRREILLKVRVTCIITRVCNCSRMNTSLCQQNKTRVNKAGELIVTSEMSRSQQRNLEDCLQKISEMIAAASQRRPDPEPEDLALRAHR